MLFVNCQSNSFFLFKAEKKNEIWIKRSSEQAICKIDIISEETKLIIDAPYIVSSPILLYQNKFIFLSRDINVWPPKQFYTVIIRIDNNENVEKYFDLSITHITHKGIGLFGSEKVISGFDLKSMQFIWKKQQNASIIKYFDDEILVLSDQKGRNLNSLLTVTGENLWSTPLDEIVPCTKIELLQNNNISFFRKDNKLWISLEDGSFILLDALSGNFIKHIINPNPLAFALTRYFHCVSENKMVKLHNQHYHEIDMETHEVRYWHLAELPSYKVLNADDDHIYLLDWKLPKFYTFNIRTRTIDFEWAVPDDHRAQMTSPLISVKLSEDYVFVGTLNSEFLFVFDKENGKVE